MAVEDQYAEYRRAWRAREAQRQAKLSALAEEARREAAGLAQALASEFGATRVILFGSLARGTPQREEFDIDLAAEGIPERKFFAAGGELLMRASRSVDLIDLGSVSERMRWLIEQYGVVLYEQRRDDQAD